MKVLIADDDYLSREGLASAIDWNRFGFDTVYMAKNGLEVLATVQLTPPDLIVTDISMPYLDGLKMIERLQALGNDICFIIVTGHNESAYMKTAIHLNVFEYIMKPVNLNELKDAVYRAKVHIAGKKLATGGYYGRVPNRRDGDEMPIPQPGRAEETGEALSDSDIDGFSEALQKGDYEGARSCFEADRQRFLKKDACSRAVLQLLCGSYISACRKELRRLSGSMEDVFDSPIGTVQEIFSQKSMGETFNALEKALHELLAYMARLTAKTANTDIEKAKEYIDRNFSNMSISLNEVAKQVNMNPAYFSVLFKKDTGVTFINYLTGVRIDKARELLGKTNMKIYEVAYAVGYDNPTYFSTVFKKITDNSPQDFRKNSSVN